MGLCMQAIDIIGLGRCHAELHLVSSSQIRQLIHILLQHVIVQATCKAECTHAHRLSRYLLCCQ